MRRLVVLAIVFTTLATAVPAVANSNDGVIAKEKASEARERSIHRKLARTLHLETYAGSEDSFTIGKDRWCDIAFIAAGDSADAYEGWGPVLISPDQDAIVKVVNFVGTPNSACLSRVKRVLHW